MLCVVWEMATMQFHVCLVLFTKYWCSPSGDMRRLVWITYCLQNTVLNKYKLAKVGSPTTSSNIYMQDLPSLDKKFNFFNPGSPIPRQEVQCLQSSNQALKKRMLCWYCTTTRHAFAYNLWISVNPCFPGQSINSLTTKQNIQTQPTPLFITFMWRITKFTQIRQP